MRDLPTLVNGGGLVLVLVLAALAALALVYVLNRQARCCTCDQPATGRHYLLNIATGERSPVCRSCFAANLRQRHRPEAHR